MAEQARSRQSGARRGPAPRWSARPRRASRRRTASRSRDHPGRRRRNGLVLQPLRHQGGALPGRRRRRARPPRCALDSSPRTSTTPPRCSRRASGSPGGCTAGSPNSARSCCTTAWPWPPRTGDSPPAPAATSKPPAGRPVHRVDDPELALAVVAGAALTLGQLLHDEPGPRRRPGRRPGHRRPAAHVGVPADEARASAGAPARPGRLASSGAPPPERSVGPRCDRCSVSPPGRCSSRRW